MKVRRNFGRYLHQIAAEVQQEGDSDYERALSLAEMLDELPADTKALYVADLTATASALNELLNHCVPRP